MKQQLLFITAFLCLTLMSFVSSNTSERKREHPGSLLFNDTTVARAKNRTVDSANLKYGLSEIFDYNSGENGVRLNPRALSFVEDYIDKNSTNLSKIKGWGLPYFNMMDNILATYGLPTELKYLAVIESKLQTGAVSWAGAVGPWQFMPETARGYGLKGFRSEAGLPVD